MKQIVAKTDLICDDCKCSLTGLGAKLVTIEKHWYWFGADKKAYKYICPSCKKEYISSKYYPEFNLISQEYLER